MVLFYNICGYVVRMDRMIMNGEPEVTGWLVSTKQVKKKLYNSETVYLKAVRIFQILSSRILTRYWSCCPFMTDKNLLLQN
jgi:hypothetical protein